MKPFSYARVAIPPPVDHFSQLRLKAERTGRLSADEVLELRAANEVCLRDVELAYARATGAEPSRIIPARRA